MAVRITLLYLSRLIVFVGRPSPQQALCMTCKLEDEGGLKVELLSVLNSAICLNV